MNLSVISLIKLGLKYMKLWPERAELATYFVDYRSVQMARLVYRVIPGLAVLTILLPFGLGFIELAPQLLVYGLFMASMPLQALVMLGVKADKFLPPSLAQWYKEGVAKYNQQGGNIKLSSHKPRYIDLATLLNISYSQVSK
jgi:uncharacterized protein